ncbi:MAG TPA: hypothetical protein VFG83_18775 [Kofleriaceae bacterium]|nr:hypothetical protein [Kofleriaceae bacterium]
MGLTKCTLQAITPHKGPTIQAKFNPTELTIERQMSWEHKGNKNDGKLEFTKSAPKALSVELLFDTFEEGTSVYDTYVKQVEALTDVIDQGGRKEPPMVLFTWGRTFPSFRGAITSLSVKYSMFFSDGTPCRATCTIQMMYSPPTGSTASSSSSGSGAGSQTAPPPVQPNETRRADRAGPNHREHLAQSGSDDGRLTPGEPLNPGGEPNRAH